MADPHTNLAKSNVAVAPSPASSGTSLTVSTGDGARFPDPGSVGQYNVTVSPFNADPDAGNAEIVRFTAKAGDVFTILRAQEGSVARTILVGDRIFASITKKTLTDIEIPLTALQTIVDLADSSAPGATSGHLKLHSLAQNGGSRLEMVQNLGSTNFILGRDNTTIVRNNTGGNITKGQAVYVSGNFLGIIPTGAPAQANSLSTLPCIGVAVDTFGPNAFGFIMKLGVLTGIDTSGFAVNDILYVSPTVAGGLTNVRPSGLTNFVDPIGVVFNSNAVTGQILVRAVGALFNRETGTNAATWTGSNVVATLFTGPVTALKSATTSVDVSAATAPTSGQVLTATSGTAATWQTPGGIGADGWIAVSDSWTFSSVDGPTGVVTIPSDGTTKYSVGMRIKFTQTTVKYGIVTAITSTTMTFYTGTGTALVNAAISANFYSSQKTPFGFPADPAVWTVITTSTANDNQTSPSNSTWYNAGSLNIVIPIGAWRVEYEGELGSTNTGTASQVLVKGTLSTANNTESDGQFTSEARLNVVTAIVGLQTENHVQRSKYLNLASKTTYFLNVETLTTMTSIGWNVGTLGFTTTIRAVCAYL